MLIAAGVTALVSLVSTLYWLERSCFESPRFIPSALLSVVAFAASGLAVDLAIRAGF